MKTILESSAVHILAGPTRLEGDWRSPAHPRGAVLFAHGSGSSRHSPRNQYVAGVLNHAGFATLLFDLLTAEEEQIDDRTGELRFEIPFLTQRLVATTDWVLQKPEAKTLRIGYFGASTGGGAALRAAVERPNTVMAVVSRGGRPDLAEEALPRVRAATLLVVGQLDTKVLKMNEDALRKIGAKHKRLSIVPGATHLFEEPGTLEQVALLASGWFHRYLSEH